MTREDAIAQALQELGLDPHDAPDVLALLETPPAEWPVCCGQLCAPCVTTLARAARRAEQLSKTDRG